MFDVEGRRGNSLAKMKKDFVANPKSRLLVLAACLAAGLGLAGEASAQNANVIVSATRDGDTATVRVTVSASFQDGATGANTFKNIQVKKSAASPVRKSASKKGFIYRIEVLWEGEKTIKAKATVRSKHGKVEATGEVEL